MTDDEPLRQLAQRRLLPRSDLRVASPQAAERLLGALLVRIEDDGSETLVRIVETEAYRETDPASHSYRGQTPRNAVMFGDAGHSYVYFTYGMHHCINVSCEVEGVGAAVLLRAAVPLLGGDRIQRRRGHRVRQRELLAGPGRLTQGLAIDRTHDGVDLCTPDGVLRLETDGYDVSGRVVRGPRVGIRQAADVPWRFHLAGVPEVSRYSRHRAAAQPPGVGED